MRWYDEELFNCKINNEKENKLLKKLIRMMSYLRLSLPNGTTIIPKPSSNLEHYTTWKSDIQRLSVIVQTTVV
jgi:hypothetical protein